MGDGYHVCLLHIHYFPILKKGDKFFDRQAGLANDGAERAGFKISISVHRHRNSPGRVIRISDYMMAPDYTINYEPCFGERANDLFPACNRQSAATHS